MNVLITGVTGGLASSIARIYLESGHTIIGTYKDKDRLDDFEPTIEKNIENFHSVEMNLLDNDSVSMATKKIRNEYDSLEILLHVAAVYDEDIDFSADSLEAVQDLFAVNCAIPIELTHKFSTLLSNANNSVVANISSGMGSTTYDALGSHTSYSASKAALNRASQILANKFQGQFSVVAVDPGWMRTRMGGSAAALDPSDSAKGIVSLLDNFDTSLSGKFISWQGEELAM